MPLWKEEVESLLGFQGNTAPFGKHMVNEWSGVRQKVRILVISCLALSNGDV